MPQHSNLTCSIARPHCFPRSYLPLRVGAEDYWSRSRAFCSYCSRRNYCRRRQGRRLRHGIGRLRQWCLPVSRPRPRRPRPSQSQSPC
ncbi:MAG: hypothetical protein EBS23_01850 [Betaproteobacteria bacterium]|nr:hypothetical protein [Betaproteobacteria bacterium]